MLKRIAGSVRNAPVPRWAWFGLLFVCASGIGWAAGAWRNLCADCPSIAQIYTYEPRQTSKVYARDSTLIWEFGDERRTLVSIESLPVHVPQAFIAIEDRRFYSHNGLDWRGIARAGLGVLRTRSLSGAGGSTITQQLARNMWTERLGFEKRLVRKLKEWQVALQLEEAYTKDQILEAYMNQIVYAHGWYGLETASRNYFGKNAIDMNPAEAALLAAIANVPERYSPLNDPAQALQRRNLVLTQMADQGFLTGEEAARWKGEPVPTERANRVEVQAPYFVEWVRGILADRFGHKLYSGGLQIYTTVDLDMQANARAAMEAGWERIEARPGYEHPTYREFSEENEGADLPGNTVPAGDVRRGGSRDRPGSRDDRGARPHPLEVRPRHSGETAGRLFLQAVRLRGGAGERHPGIQGVSGRSSGPSPAGWHPVATVQLQPGVPRCDHHARSDGEVDQHGRDQGRRVRGGARDGGADGGAARDPHRNRPRPGDGDRRGRRDSDPDGRSVRHPGQSRIPRAPLPGSRGGQSGGRGSLETGPREHGGTRSCRGAPGRFHARRGRPLRHRVHRHSLGRGRGPAL